MLWIWLSSLLNAAVRFFIPPPANKRGLGRIDPQSPCPVCGNVGLTLRAMAVPVQGRANRVMVAAVCHTCSYTHLQPPISVPKYSGWTVNQGQEGIIPQIKD